MLVTLEQANKETSQEKSKIINRSFKIFGKWNIEDI